MLPEVIEPKRDHGKLSSFCEKSMAGVPLKEATPAWLRSSPPKRLFGLGDDVAPGKADIVQVTGTHFGQLPPIDLALPPDVKGLAELGKKPGTMMICH
jgi:hypothetical protein